MFNNWRFPVIGVLLFVFVFLCAGCSLSGSKENKVRVAVLYDEGTAQDALYNERIFDGVAQAEKKYGDKVEIINLRLPQDSAQRRMEFFDSSVRNGNYALVIDSDLHYLDQSRELCKKYPKTMFAVIDDNILKNVAGNYISVNYNETQQGFLAGCIAALSCNGLPVGILDAEQDINPDFKKGIIEGIKYINPGIKIVKKSLQGKTDDSNGILSTFLISNSFEGADALFKDGCSVVIADWQIDQKAALHAAFINKGYMIGCDVNLEKLSGAWSNYLLASVTKNYEKAVDELIGKAVSGKMQGMVVNYSLANQGIRYDEFKSVQLLKIEPQLRKIADDLIRGTLKAAR